MGLRELLGLGSGARRSSELVPVLLPNPLRQEVLRVRAKDGEVAAVRLVRRSTGLDLVSAVRAVRAAEDDDEAVS